jgi:TPR repeat protein
MVVIKAPVAGVWALLSLILSGPPQAPSRCWDSQQDLDACSAAESRDADEELNRTYVAIMRSLDPEARKVLREAERSWLEYRDAHRAAVLPRHQGHGPTRRACESMLLTRLTEERADELRVLAGLRADDAPEGACAPVQRFGDLPEAQRRLDEVYTRTLETLDESQGQLIRNAHRAWLNYRKGHAEATRLLVGPAACDDAVLTRMTTSRAIHLGSFSKGDPEARCAGLAARGRSFARARTECSEGDTNACWSLGNLYEGGYPDVINNWRALEAYRRACQDGYARACTSLGAAYKNGRGAVQDLSRAFDLYQAGCEGGDPFGCEILAGLYARGDGVPPDPARGRALWQRACDVANPEKKGWGGAGQFCRTLAIALEVGDPLPRDVDHAIALHERACKSDEYNSCWRAAQLLLAREPAQTARAIPLLRKACEGFNTHEACVQLGEMYRRGDGVRRDVASARTLLESACNDGFLPACRAERALTGESPPGDPDDPIDDPGYIMSVRVTVHPERPPLRLRLFGDSYGIVSGIAVFDEGRGEVTQHLAVPETDQEVMSRPYRGEPGLETADLNFDGYQDLMLRSWAGATGNAGHLIWMFEPEREEYVFSKELSELPGLRVHPAEKALTSFMKGGHGGMICGSTVYRWVDGRLTAVAGVSQDWDPEAGAYVKVIEEQAGGQLMKVRRETRVFGNGGVELTVDRFSDGRWERVETVREKPEEKPSCWNILEDTELPSP